MVQLKYAASIVIVAAAASPALAYPLNFEASLQTRQNEDADSVFSRWFTRSDENSEIIERTESANHHEAQTPLANPLHNVPVEASPAMPAMPAIPAALAVRRELMELVRRRGGGGRGGGSRSGGRGHGHHGHGKKSKKRNSNGSSPEAEAGSGPGSSPPPSPPRQNTPGSNAPSDFPLTGPSRRDLMGSLGGFLSKQSESKKKKESGSSHDSHHSGHDHSDTNAHHSGSHHSDAHHDGHSHGHSSSHDSHDLNEHPVHRELDYLFYDLD